MSDVSSADRPVRFGRFTLDPGAHELRREGVKLRIADQPFTLLCLLVSRAGRLVSREEVRAHLWPSDTYVGFDASLNSAMRKLRDALQDSAEHPTLIETVPKRGYRFIAPLEIVDGRRQRTTIVPTPGVSAAVALALAVALAVASVGGFPRLRSGGAVNADAQSAYMKGVLAAGGRDIASYVTAIRYFEGAIAKQPDFANAYAALAQAQLQFLFFGPWSPREVVPKAEAAARRAVQYDPTLPAPHRVLSVILQNYYWHWDEAQVELRRARLLEGTTTETRLASAKRLIRYRRFDEAEAELGVARRSDPVPADLLIEAGTAYRAVGEFGRAVAALRDAAQLAPAAPRPRFQLGLTLLRLGQADAAVDALEQAAHLSHANARLQAALGVAYITAGRADEGRAILRALEERSQREYVSAFGIALMHDALGEGNAALVAFERAFEEHAIELAQIGEYPPFKTIAANPVFQRRLQAIGRPLDGGPI